MSYNPLESLQNYSRFTAELLNRPTIEHSTLSVWSDSPYTGIAEGDIYFIRGFRLRVREELDFADGIIMSMVMKYTKLVNACIGMMIFHIPGIRS